MNNSMEIFWTELSEEIAVKTRHLFFFFAEITCRIVKGVISLFKKRYSDGYADYPGVGKITDEMVAKYVRNHTHWWNRLDYHKISDASIAAFGMLAGYIEKPKKKRWFF